MPPAGNDHSSRYPQQTPAPFARFLLRHQHGLDASRFIPQRQFNTVPKAKFIVNDAKIILHDVFGGANRVGHFAVLQAFGDKLDDALFPFTGDAISITFIGRHVCLL